MEITIEIILIFVLSIFQSVFGVGLLLFGTPIFLLNGYSFETTLVILLPVSIFISFLQIISHKKFTKSLISEYNHFCLPFLVMFLIIAVNTVNLINIKICVSILLIISSLIVLNKNRIHFIKKYILKYRKLSLIFIGCIHGFTNMGGGFLSVFSALVNGEDKKLTRNYISYGYFTMGIIQFITILCIGLNNINFTKLYYVLLPLIIFFPSQKIYVKIDSQTFIKMINYFAFVFGAFALILSLK